MPTLNQALIGPDSHVACTVKPAIKVCESKAK